MDEDGDLNHKETRGFECKNSQNISDSSFYEEIRHFQNLFFSENDDERILAYEFFNKNKFAPNNDAISIILQDQNNPNIIISTNAYILCLNNRLDTSSETFSRLLHDDSPNPEIILLKLLAIKARSQNIIESNAIHQDEISLIIARSANLLKYSLMNFKDHELTHEIAKISAEIQLICNTSEQESSKFIKLGFHQIYLETFNFFEDLAILELIMNICIMSPKEILESAENLISWLCKFLLNPELTKMVLCSLSSFVFLSLENLKIIQSNFDIFNYIHSLIGTCPISVGEGIVVFLSSLTKYAEIDEIYSILTELSYGNYSFEFINASNSELRKICIEGILRMLLKHRDPEFDDSADVIDEFYEIVENDEHETTCVCFNSLKYLIEFQNVPTKDLIIDILSLLEQN